MFDRVHIWWQAWPWKTFNAILFQNVSDLLNHIKTSPIFNQQKAPFNHFTLGKNRKKPFMQYGHILTYVYLYLTLQHCSQFLLKTSLNIRYLLLLSVNFHVNFLIVPSPEPHSPLSKDTVSLDLLENMTVSQNTSGLSTISPNQTFLRFILAGLRSGFLLAVLPL